MKRSDSAHVGWLFWPQWVLANAVGWGVGWSVAWTSHELLSGQPVGGLFGGVCLGLLQWMLLRRQIPRADWWIWANAVGWGVGWGVAVAVGWEAILRPMARGAAAGAAGWAAIGIGVGLLQWMVLRGQSSRAGWWVLVSAGGWAVGGALDRPLFLVLGRVWDTREGIGRLVLEMVVPWGITGAIGGAVTGLALVWLLRQHVPLKHSSVPSRWDCWLQWLLANIAGTIFMYVEILAFTPVGGSVRGLWLGLLQWVVLRQQVSQAGWWILMTAVGGALSGAVDCGGGLYGALSNGALSGLWLGLLQWVVLRQQVSQAGWWVLAMPLSWGIAWGIGWVGSDEAGTITGAIGGAVSGTVLVWLLRHRVLLKMNAEPVGWDFWLQWVSVTAMGLGALWTVSRALLGNFEIVISSIVIPAGESMGRVAGWAIGGAAVGTGLGAMIGLLQWIVLRQQVSQAGWWVLATAVGWGLGWAVGGPVVGIVRRAEVVTLSTGWAVSGLWAGLLQWVVLRQQVFGAKRWMLVSAVIGALGWLLGWLTGWVMGGVVGRDLAEIVGSIVLGLVGGAITGFPLIRLLRHRTSGE
jgi:hypothetical protein